MEMDARAVAEWFRLFDWSPTDVAWSQRQRSIWAWRKYRKARRWARVLMWIPFIRLIAIGNALGYGNCEDGSDIDLVIIAAPWRVWFVRLCVVTLLRLFRQRPGEQTRDAICPSFFLTAEAMGLESLQIPPLGARGGEGELRTTHRNPSLPPLILRRGTPELVLPDDPYLLFWLTQLTVLYDAGNTYDAFWRANEQWVRRWLPEARPRAIHPRLVARRTWWHWVKSARERILHGRFGDVLDRWCRRFQERRFSSEIRMLANQDSRVIVSDRMLKLHTNDRRAAYRDVWLRRLEIAQR